ncbi:hypothetical protein PSQ90_14915 [Devosia rhodophyticola]|uniref:Uncharacterized protein n=1 Tax=Devosia rhodophyticola TaxID=3026423 RepID=A0ABY7YWT3_9HYPH|nr:hypothetical protein [Devosia rhodophyticola]WDR05548.1 hypothetical protein PSQ90_14915 [Devosia rhodophyticola]
MNLLKASGILHRLAFRTMRAASSFIPGGRIAAFGSGNDQIGAIIVVNLDRQPKKLRRVKRELGRFRMADGFRLTSMVNRFSAIDARAVAASADIDPNYRIADQLHVHLTTDWQRASTSTNR